MSGPIDKPKIVLSRIPSLKKTSVDPFIFNTPLAVAVCSVSLAILKVFVAMIFVSKLIHVNFFKLFPAGRLGVLVLHSIATIAVVDILITQVLPPLSNLVTLIVAVSGFVILLLSTAKVFKVDYVAVVKPLIPGATKNAVEI